MFLFWEKSRAEVEAKKKHTPIHSSLESKFVNKISGKKLFKLKMLCNYNNKQTNKNVYEFQPKRILCKKKRYLNHKHNNERAIGIEPPNHYGKMAREVENKTKQKMERKRDRERGKPKP